MISRMSNSLDDIYRMVRNPKPVDIKKNANGDLEIGDIMQYAATSNLNSPAVLTWQDLSVTCQIMGSAEPKILLNNLNGTISGGLWAIMGPSGSGKTTFLGVLSQRLDTHKMPTSGTIHLNGKPYDDMILKAMSGYVMQDDLMHAYLTVHETLMYAALLRMPKNSTREERENREKEVLELMGITYTKDVIIGDSRHKGISGGERKRVAVAVELLTKPKLLFLDEPTSGLDSTSALALVKRLKEMTDKGMCTIVCTIHQPQAKIFNLFDNLILMKKGNIIYQGLASKAVDYFTSTGHPCPEMENPADYIMDIISTSNPDDKGQDKIVRMTPPVDLDYGAEKQDFLPKDWPLWFFQFYILLRRNLKEWKLRWYIIALNLLVTTAVSLFICMGAWYQIGIYSDSVPKRNAILFFCVIHQGVVASLQGTYSFPLDRALFLRERAAGTYYVSSYYVAKFFTDMLVQVPMPILFSCIVYPTVQLSQVNNSKMLIFIAISILCSQSCTALANMCSCVFVSIEMSTVALAFFLEITRLYSGFFISPLLLNSNPQYNKFKFVDVISYMKYSYVGYCVNEYTDLKLDCLPGQLNASKQCAITRGEQIMAQFGYDQYTVEFCCWMMVVYIFIARFIGYVALKYIKV